MVLAVKKLGKLSWMVIRSFLLLVQIRPANTACMYK